MENPHSGAENGGVASSEKFDGMANWVTTSLASVFFASLERFSCINLATSDTDDEIDVEAKDRPLMLSAQNSPLHYRSDDPKFAPVWAPPYH